jgi:hypothetical protein
MYLFSARRPNGSGAFRYSSPVGTVILYRGVKLTTNLHSVPQLMCEAISALPHMSSWQQAQTVLYNFTTHKLSRVWRRALVTCKHLPNSLLPISLPVSLSCELQILDGGTYLCYKGRRYVSNTGKFVSESLGLWTFSIARNSK